MPLETLARKASEWGYDGLELACWGDHLDVRKAAEDKNYCEERKQLLARYGLNVWAISNHLVGQAVLDPIDERHKAILPPHVWGDGDPNGVRERAIEEMKLTARAAKNLGVQVVNGFTGSPIWHLVYPFPPVPPQMIEDGFKKFAETWKPILDEFEACGVKFALEVHPTEIAFDLHTARKALEGC
jgi:sugar phosphate isomerase/epimerase